MNLAIILSLSTITMQNSSFASQDTSRTSPLSLCLDCNHQGHGDSDNDQSTDYIAGVSDFEGATGSESSGSTQSSCQTPLVSDAESDHLSGSETELSRSSSETSYTVPSEQKQYDIATSMNVFLTQGKELLHVDEKKKPRSESESEIVEYSRNGDIPGIKRLIAQHCDVDETDSNGRTALHVASSLGRVGIVKLLVQSGADVDACSTSGKSPLHEACINGRLDVLQALISEVADLDMGDSNGLSAAHYCALNGEEKCLSLLCNQASFLCALDR